MAIEKITMPQLGESVTEGTISKWLVEVGDNVNKYDPLADVLTDKVNAEIPSSYSGVIKEIIANEGDTLKVGEIICLIETELVKENTKITTNVKIDEEIINQSEAPKHSKEGKVRFSPAVLKLSQEHGIQLNEITGTGAGGRITRKDVLNFIESNGNSKGKNEENIPAIMNETTSSIEENNIPLRLKPEKKPPFIEGDIEVPVSGIRKAIADHMVISKHEIPHAWMMVEVDVTNLVGYRNSIKDEFRRKEGYNLTFFAFFVKAVATAIKEFPEINSMWAGNKIIRKKDVNLSIAVATENELFTPVIKNADEKTIKGIAREINELAIKVRTGQLKMNDLQDGTFTVNNTGSIGSVQSMGIINHPQAAILQVESIVKRPMVINDNMIAIRDMVNLCLSLDHRVLDGFICGKFMGRVKEILESSSKEHTPIY